MPPLSNFPFLSPGEFHTICVSLERRVNAFHNSVSSGQGHDATATATMMEWREVGLEERVSQVDQILSNLNLNIYVVI